MRYLTTVTNCTKSIFCQNHLFFPFTATHESNSVACELCIIKTILLRIYILALDFVSIIAGLCHGMAPKSHINPFEIVRLCADAANKHSRTHTHRLSPCLCFYTCYSCCHFELDFMSRALRLAVSSQKSAVLVLAIICKTFCKFVQI